MFKLTYHDLVGKNDSEYFYFEVKSEKLSFDFNEDDLKNYTYDGEISFSVDNPNSFNGGFTITSKGNSLKCDHESAAGRTTFTIENVNIDSLKQCFEKAKKVM